VVEKPALQADVVFHLAAHANIRTSLVDHRRIYDNNLIGNLNKFNLEKIIRHSAIIVMNIRKFEWVNASAWRTVFPYEFQERPALNECLRS